MLPAFLSVTDDPTLKELDGVRLAGYYDYDDEGVPAARVVAVENGVLKNFLMSRMPITNFSQSNGHGRRQPGLMATGRQGNLIVTSTHTVKDAELRKQFVEEIKKQGKTYGLYFDDIQGGFTLTGRASPQAFQVLPVMVYRVYADGRPGRIGARRGYRGYAAAFPEQHYGHRRHHARVQRSLRRGIRTSSRIGLGAGDVVFRNRSAKEEARHGSSAHPAATGSRRGFHGETVSASQPFEFPRRANVRRYSRRWSSLLLPSRGRSRTHPPPQRHFGHCSFSDPILKAMREELDRSKSLLQMENLAAPYYIEYRVCGRARVRHRGGVRRDSRETDCPRAQPSGGGAGRRLQTG